ncbi:MAG TPA: hypothetical protein VGG69_08185 [Rhizomicrobium sp.]|jgi:hypothetical protein
MRILGEYRGVMFSIPRNDDGIWHYSIHPKRDRRTSMFGMPPGSGPEGVPSRQEAIAAAKRAIDAWLAVPDAAGGTPAQPPVAAIAD